MVFWELLAISRDLPLAHFFLFLLLEDEPINAYKVGWKIMDYFIVIIYCYRQFIEFF